MQISEIGPKRVVAVVGLLFLGAVAFKTILLEEWLVGF
jgi:hypothetical protein